MNSLSRLMNASTPKVCNSDETLARRIGERAGNLFLTHQLWCSGSVLMALNRSLAGDLTQDQLIRLTAGLGDGIGGSGCLCGGLNGATLALGLFLGHGRMAARGDPIVITSARKLYAQFKSEFGSACCRVLIKKGLDNSCRKFHLCAQRTAKAAELAAQLIFHHKPELMLRIDGDYLNQKDSRLGARVKMIANRMTTR